MKISSPRVSWRGNTPGLAWAAGVGTGGTEGIPAGAETGGGGGGGGAAVAGSVTEEGAALEAAEEREGKKDIKQMEDIKD